MEHIQRIVDPNPVIVKMRELKRKFELLDAKREDVEKELEYETKRSCNKRPRKEVQNWIADVQRAKPRVEELQRQVSEDRFLKRFLLEGRVDILAREVHEPREESKFERGLTLETYDNEGIAFLTKKLIGEAFEENKRTILDCLLSGEDSIVGVYGMGGVGKTTLVTHIHNELLRRPNLNVSWVTVSQNSNIQKLQEDIAKTVRLDLSREDDVRKRAAILANALVKKRNLILIMDDVWEDISLLDVGICVSENLKLVLTTRSLKICQKLDCERPIKVEPLLEGEDWTLFAETLNNDALLSDHGINEIAKSLVKECGGVPLGIFVMAGSMRGADDIHEWSNALKEIKEATYRSNDDMYDRVFLVLSYSYDRLIDSKVKECFLYCCLFPEDSRINRDVLIQCLIDENLIDGKNGRISAFEKGHTILNKLENVCLLEAQKDRLGRTCVKMHDLVRDMAIKMTSGRFLVQARMRLRDFPREEQWTGDLLRASLTFNEINHIPLNTSPNCPKLTTLFLQGDHSLGTLPDNIFSNMKKLTILDLSRINIKCLPMSMDNLTSLTALLLNGCQLLEWVRSLENLTALRRLDLSCTSIDEVPRGMMNLTDLRHLDLRECKKLKIMPEGVLPQLAQLECFWSSFKLVLRGGEVGQLKKLEGFCGLFNDMSELNTCLTAWGGRRPTNYDILMSLKGLSDVDEYFPEHFTNCKRVHVINSDITLSSDDETEVTCVLPSDADIVHLHFCDNIRSLSQFANTNGLMIHSSVGESMRRGDVSLSLSLGGFEGQPMLTETNTRISPSNTFSALKKLVVFACNRLTKLFTISMLPVLETLSVEDCKELVETMRTKTLSPSPI